jgi:hypothetical protein
VEPLAIIDVLEEAADPGAGIVGVAIGAAVDLFLLQGVGFALPTAS